MKNKYQAIIENAGEGIVVSQEGRVVYFNKNIREMTGYTSEEMTETPFINFIHPDDKDTVMKEYHKRVSGVKDKAKYKVRVVTKGDIIRIFSVNSVLIEWEEKPATLVFLSDITEQVAITEELKNSEANLRALIDSSIDAICVRDRQAALILWNEAFNQSCKALFGVEASVGLLTNDLVPDDQREGTKHAKKAFYNVFKGKASNSEFEYKWPNGEIHFYEITYTPVKKGNDIYAVAEITRDITDRKTAEFELKKNLEHFKGYLHSSTEGIFSFEINPPMPMTLTIDEQIDYFYDHAHIVVANDAWAKYAGYDKLEDIIELTLEQCVPRSIPENKAIIKKLAESDYILDGFITRETTKQGELRIIHNTHNREIKDGYLIRTWGTARDVTESRAIEEEAQRLRQEISHIDRVSIISEMSTSLAHELNQPLTAILSNAQAALRFLEKEEPDIDEIKDILKDIVDDDKRAGKVISGLRSLLKKHETVFETMDINKLINDILIIANSDVLIKNTNINIQCDPDLPLAGGDYIQTQQVLLNLIMNAMDAMKDSPDENNTLIIKTERHDNYNIKVSVMDSGKGLKENELEDIFNPFYTTKPDGLGMGLSICKSIIRNQKGRLWAENNHDGGATFYFTLPVKKGEHDE